MTTTVVDSPAPSWNEPVVTGFVTACGLFVTSTLYVAGLDIAPPLLVMVNVALAIGYSHTLDAWMFGTVVGVGVLVGVFVGVCDGVVVGVFVLVGVLVGIWHSTVLVTVCTPTDVVSVSVP